MHNFQHNVSIFGFLTCILRAQVSIFQKINFFLMVSLRVLLTSAPGALFKDPKFRKYFLKKSNLINSNALITRIFVKKLLLKVLKECTGGTH
jgi:hypothetical protein